MAKFTKINLGKQTLVSILTNELKEKSLSQSGLYISFFYKSPQQDLKMHIIIFYLKTRTYTSITIYF